MAKNESNKGIYWSPCKVMKSNEHTSANFLAYMSQPEHLWLC